MDIETLFLVSPGRLEGQVENPVETPSGFSGSSLGSGVKARKQLGNKAMLAGRIDSISIRDICNFESSAFQSKMYETAFRLGLFQ
jgi:hypothetical protein